MESERSLQQRNSQMSEFPVPFKSVTGCEAMDKIIV